MSQIKQNKKKLFLFDVDGTITESGQKMNKDHIIYLNTLKQDSLVELGIVGGGTLNKILWQTDGIKFDHYFTECGCVYDRYFIETNKLIQIYTKDIRKHYLYSSINLLVKAALKYISEVDYEITGHFIDLRNGIIYISLIGLAANENERKKFIELDNTYFYRKKLFQLLINKALELNIYNKVHIVYGGSVGIAIYPSEYDKVQIMDNIDTDNYSEIHYFGDKYLCDGNDYMLLNHLKIIGHSINAVNETFYYLKNIISNSNNDN